MTAFNRDLASRIAETGIPLTADMVGGGAKCRCDEPGADPYQCEADDCHGYRSEEDPFGGGLYERSVRTRSAEVSRKCGQCTFRTSVWHVDDGSADEELHRHVTRTHEEAAS